VADSTSPSPLRRTRQLIQQFAGFGHQQHTLLLAIRIVLRANAFPVAITKVDLVAHLLGYARGQRHTHPGSFHTVLVRSQAIHMRTMGEHTPWQMLEPIPLLKEIVAAMITGFPDVVPMTDAHFMDVRRI